MNNKHYLLSKFRYVAKDKSDFKDLDLDRFLK